jgi:anti-sigma regulatory factor (Ser/Thr protein kinase)
MQADDGHTSGEAQKPCASHHFRRRRQQQNIKRLVREADTQLYSIGIFDPFEYRSRTPVGWQRFWLWLEHHQGTVGWFWLAFERRQEDCWFLEIDAWMPSKVRAISALVDWLMRQIEGSRCVAGYEPAVELALQEDLSNAVIHGNRTDADKLAHIQCQCEVGKRATIVVTDHGQGFDPNGVPDPLAIEQAFKSSATRSRV